MVFREGDEILEIEILRYERRLEETDPGTDDRNWLVLRGTWTRDDGTVRKGTSACLLTYELQELCAGLKVLRAGIRERYESDLMAPGLSLTGRAVDGDRFALDVSFWFPDTMDGDDTAEISCMLGKADLRALTDELDRLCAAFPDR